MVSYCWLLVGLVGIVQSITVDDLYPFNPQQDHRLPNGDYRSSHKIALSVPAKFYDTEYDYLWINVDGYISFQPNTSDVSESDFPFKEALLSPFMADLDTTNQGEIYYRESNDVGVLIRATSDIQLAFPTTASDFDAESAFIVTWHGVEGRSMDRSIARFTFQCIIVSNGRDSYAIFLYPERKMGIVPAGVKLKSALFQARAGFNEGTDKFLEMYPVEGLVNHRNTHRNGEWIFQIGGAGVKRNREPVAPENARLVRRQASIINVQEVNLEEEEGEDTDDGTIFVPRLYDYCSRDQEACVARNSECVNHENGYCCRCLPDFYGNGKVCIEDQQPIRVNGNVSGVVDVRRTDGSIERMQIRNVDFHSYVITSEGRAYTAVSGVEPTLGRALQPISAIGEIVGWLFAVPTPPAVNGFQFTGGSFQRQVGIKFNNSDFKFDMRQRFLGVRQEEDANVVVAHTHFVGLLPYIDADAAVKMATYSEVYVKEGPGRITSKTVREYTVNDTPWQYTITQDIIFNECKESLSSVPDNLKLMVSGTFLNYHDDDNNVRFAMNDKITPLSTGNPSNPCFTGAHNCDPLAGQCEPVEGSSTEFNCRCRDGYVGDGTICDDIDECLRNPCPRNAFCTNNAGSYSCGCESGYKLNPRTQQCEEIECPGNQVFSTCASCFTTCDERGRPKICTLQCRVQCTCPPGLPYLEGDYCVTEDQCPSPGRYEECRTDADCGPGTCISNRCNCPAGFSVVSGTCQDIDECTERSDACDENADCFNSQGSYTCVCKLGYSGDGRTCRAVECPGNQVFSRCASCFTTCEERGRPKICTLQCRVQCTCPPELPYLEGDYCVTEDQCPSPATPAPETNCRRRQAEVDRFFRENPGIQDGPNYPMCDAEGQFERKQCNTLSGACWCVEPESGTRIAGTMTQGTLDCSPTQTTPPCTQLYNELLTWQRQHPEIQDGADFPECQSDGTFEPRQCNDFTRACWCVDPQIGVMIPGTEAKEDCSATSNIPRTPCQREREQARREQNSRPSGARPVYEPICTQAGAYEPMQYHPDGYYMCVDVNGQVITTHSEQPECLTSCQLSRYYAETQNTLIGTDYYVPQCKEDGSYSSVQCDAKSRTCYCADQNGEEIQGTRISTANFQDDGYRVINCAKYTGGRRNRPVKLVVANSRSVSYVDLPVNNASVAERFFERSGRMAIGVAFDCSSDTVYWTDVVTRSIYKAPLSDATAASVVISGLGSPEGIAVDFITGNIYWSDSSLRRIEVASSDGSSRQTLISSGLKNPRGIAVDPFGGKMYWTDWNRVSPKVMMANMDGSSREVLVGSGLDLPNNIAIDPYFRKACFLDSGEIKCMNLDGSELRKVWTNTAAGKPFGIAVDGNKVYYSNRIHASIMPVKRLHAVDIVGLTSISIPGAVGVHGNMFGLAIAYTECPVGYNHCSRANGECQHLCLPVPSGRTCSAE